MVSESEPMTTMMDGVAADSHGAAVIVRVYLSSTWSKAGSREEERKEGEREGGKGKRGKEERKEGEREGGRGGRRGDRDREGKGGEREGAVWAFGTSKPTPSDTLPPTIPPNLAQQVPLTGDQAFKALSLWGHCHSAHCRKGRGP
jgi:hypothetical protein